MRKWEHDFKNGLQPLIAWTFTENKILRKLLGLTVLPLIVLGVLLFCLIISPYILWKNTLEDVFEDTCDSLNLIVRWFE